MSPNLTLFTATVTGQQTNTRYPNKRTITNTTDLKAATMLLPSIRAICAQPLGSPSVTAW